MNKNTEIFKNASDLALKVANEILIDVKKSADKNSNYYLALSGGSTPVVLFRILSESDFKNFISWEKVHLFWADERCVPPDSDESNYGVVNKILLDKINIPEENVHRIKGENNPETEAEEYAYELEKILPVKNNLPFFNHILLGMGEDGHTASLFPGKELNPVFKNITGVTAHPETSQKRISLTKDIINNSEKISFMVTGRNKAEIIAKIFDRNSKEIYPAGEIKGNIKWYLDEPAAKLLK